MPSPASERTAIAAYEAVQSAARAPVGEVWGAERSYVTDDRDHAPLNSLRIMQGGNGDWYVSVAPHDQGGIGKAVRLCTSGGASRACPGLTAAIADAYRAMGSEKPTPAPPTPAGLELPDGEDHWIREHDEGSGAPAFWSLIVRKTSPGRLHYSGFQGTSPISGLVHESNLPTGKWHRAQRRKG